MGQHFIYQCDCGVEIQAETWDPNELPRLWCPECGERMEFRRDPKVYE
jgi:DNA-directed RNA polymerase subunit RPC12/RpoP